MRLRFFFGPSSTSSPHPFRLQQLAFLTVPSESSTHLGNASEFQTYALLLQSCLRQCKELKTHQAFDEMPQRLFGLHTTGKIIHARSLKLGFWSKGSLGNALLDLYAKCGNVGVAEKVFSRLENRDVLAWNSVLSMYLKQDFIDLAVKNFGLLWNNGEVRPNEFSFAIVLSACAKLESLLSGRQLHCNLVKMGFESFSFCLGALIDMYTKCTRIDDARRVFDGAVELDTVSWTSMILGYVQAGLHKEALRIFEDMKQVGREPDQVALVTVINACIGLGRLDDASDLFFQMPNPNVVAWNMMISGHARRGYEVDAIKFFQTMRKSGIKSTRSTLGSVLSAIASVAALNYGMVVHGEAIKLGLHSNAYVGSSLISMYAKCVKMEAARKIFDALGEQNVVLWNAMLGGYAQNGHAYEVMELFSDIASCGFQPDEFTYTSILSACAYLKYLDVGHQLHSVLVKKKFASNLFVGNALVDMYAKCGVLDDARKQFDLIRNRDNVSWNAIIAGYVQGQYELEAFHMFQRMYSLGIQPDEASLASILSACANAKSLVQGKQLHCFSVKSGKETSLYAGSSLIGMYAKCGDIRSAQKVLAAMPEWSVVSMNSLIAGYAPLNLFEAIILYRRMQAEGLYPSEITFASLLDACDGPQKFDLGRQIHCLVLKRGFQYDDEFLGVSLLGVYMKSLRKTDASILFSEFSNPKSTVLWTAMISGLTQSDSCEDALQFYRQMRKCNALPDQATFVSVLKACAVLSSIGEGREIHSLIFRTGFDLDELTCSALVDMYAKCGDVKSSRQVFEEIGIKDNAISWNSMIVGFAKNGYAEDALRVFDKMKQTDVIPDDITFLGVLNACSHAGRVSEGLQIFDLMVNYYRIQPRVDHCGCMVDLLGRCGLLKEAEDFIYKLNFEHDPMIWATMLGACKTHGDDIRGRQAAEKLIELEPQNSSPYVLLSNLHAASGNWSEVKELRSAMREKGVKKLPGCSWIVLGQKTNLFSAGDKSHPCAAEIDAVLRKLKALMKEDGYVARNDFDFYAED